MKTGVKKVVSLAKKNSPTILAVYAGVGVVGTIVLTARATYRTIQKCEVEEQRRGQPLEARDYLQIGGLEFLLPVLVGGTVIAAVVGIRQIDAKRLAVADGLYTATAMSLQRMQDTTREMVGEKRYQEIQQEMHERYLKDVRRGISEEKITVQGDLRDGDVPCVDMTNGRVFYSSATKIRMAENTINRRLRSEDFVSLNDLYFELGLGPVKFGDEKGFHVDTGLEFEFTSHLDEFDRPMLVVDFVVQPESRQY